MARAMSRAKGKKINTPYGKITVRKELR